MGKGSLLELAWNCYDTDCAAIYATLKRIGNMVVTDKMNCKHRKNQYCRMRRNFMISMPEINTELQIVNTHIERLCRSNSESMQEMLDWVLKARGKQVRPLLTLLCAKLKGKSVDVTEVAAVIEICHTASLIHDDIIDEADTRRGQLSVQKKFGREMAVYAGDFMIFAAISRTGLRKKPYYSSIFEKLEKMCDGEVSQFEHRYNRTITGKKYIENIIGKTSAMFSIACGVGAYEGKCTNAFFVTKGSCYQRVSRRSRRTERR